MGNEEKSGRHPISPQFDVVAIGASAGGIEALYAVVGALPVQFPAAVLIVQHMDPRHKSMLAGLLGRRSKLVVRQAISGESVQPATVHIAQPDMHLIARDRRLVLTDTKLVHFSRPSIDLFVRVGRRRVRRTEPSP